MAELDWGGLHCQSHVMAKGFANDGHRVFYINRTLQRWPRFRHLMTRLRPAPQSGIQPGTEVPEGIAVINLWVGPPVAWLRPLNFMMIWLTMRKYSITDLVMLTYVPTYNCFDLIPIIKARLIAYVCYHNFDADIVLPDLLKSEKKIIERANVLFADSRFLVERIKRLSGGKVVHQAPPGVYFDQFSKAFRGDEVMTLKKICFFGGAGSHLDIATYNQLCEKYEVHFIAVISNDIKDKIDPRIIISPPVKNHELPALLYSMDVLTILYVNSPYINAVLPAKFFECIATGKPLLVSGLPELKYYDDCVYNTENNPGKAITILQNLKTTHTDDRIKTQMEVGRKADFNIRYREMADKILRTHEN